MKKLLIIVLLALMGCTSRYTSGPDEDDLTTDSCTVYQEEDGAIIECPDGSSAIIQNGVDGNNGIDGTNGINGVDGNNGQNGISENTLNEYFYCEAQLNNTDLFVHYTLSIFSGGFVFVNAGVYGPMIEINNSAMYSNFHVDAQAAPVYFTYDLAGDINGGYWRIYRQAQTAIVDYIDIDEQLSWQITECVYENY
tara:strand:- start:1 stop:585 length:585 start_codon:yes stop_codon:yes gene_type:complete